jgi:tRNA threonylcarbamoyl adenosine modification protein YeaZ
MLTLAFDTCFQCCSAAVGDGTGRVLAAVDEPMEIGHGERLMPMLGEVLAAAGAGYRDVARIAVTRGPGSFTGLRIGVAAARGLALALDRPIVSATSLELIAAPLIERDQVLAVAIATRDRLIYLQAFENGTSTYGPQLATPSAAAAALPLRRCRIVGSGSTLLAEARAALHLETDADLPTVLPRAHDLIAIVDRLPVAAPLVPLYLREPDAKPQVTPAVLSPPGPE